MKIIDRYIGRTIIGGVVTALGVLVAIFSFFTFVDQLDDVGKGGYGILQILSYVVLSMPRLAYELFPVAALIGSLMGLSLLVSGSEITVIRAAGVSLPRTVLAVMKGGFVLMLVAVLIGEFIAPPAEQMARYERSIAIANQITLKTRHGFWARDGRSYINIRTILPGDRIEDIYIYEFDEHNRLQISTYAKSASYVDGQWILHGIEQTNFKEESVEKRKISRAAWESLLRPDLINMVVIEPNSLSIYDLVKYVRYLRLNGQNTLRYEQALWIKLIYPLATAVMVFLAIPLVLGSMRPASIGQRVVAGCFIGLAFHILNQASGHLGVVFEINPALSATAPTLLTLAAAGVMMRRLS